MTVKPTRPWGIISGGQTGADQAGLAAAKELGLKSGGWMPMGFRTQAGPRFDMREIYGMREHPSPKYPPRTEANVIEGEATLIFGNAGSPGCSLTVRLCTKHERPFYLQRWMPYDTISDLEVGAFQMWLRVIGAGILNVAGNREESQPGIFNACRDFLVRALSAVPPTGLVERSSAPNTESFPNNNIAAQPAGKGETP